MINAPIPDANQMPDALRTATGLMKDTQPTTSSNIGWLLAELGVTVRFDMMRGRMVLCHPQITDSQRDQTGARRLVMDMATRMGMKNLALVDDILMEFADLDRYHPMADWVRGVTWDGHDYVGDLIETVTTDNPLWGTYLENWLVQVMEGVCGWSRGYSLSLPHVLVLVGGQGLGKTAWFSRLGGSWIMTEAELHLASGNSKDHQITVLSNPMAELAELDGIFRKSDIAHLKSFISRTEDKIRAPYARAAIERPRMTTFCGSVNEAEFLNDSTGSRRFWPVEVTAIDWDFEMDWAQLWAQVYDMWVGQPGFNLTSDQEAQRELIGVESHTMVGSEDELITDYFRVHKGNPTYPVKAMNRTEILAMLYGKNTQFSNKQVSDIGKVLVRISGKHKTIDTKQRCWLVPFNETAADTRTWPKKNHLESVK